MANHCIKLINFAYFWKSFYAFISFIIPSSLGYDCLQTFVVPLIAFCTNLVSEVFDSKWKLVSMRLDQNFQVKNDTFEERRFCLMRHRCQHLLKGCANVSKTSLRKYESKSEVLFNCTHKIKLWES